VKPSKDLIHNGKSTGSTSKYLVTAGINDGHSVTLGLTMWKAAHGSSSSVVRRVRTVSAMTLAVTSYKEANVR
jgi:hypothetical protein